MDDPAIGSSSRSCHPGGVGREPGGRARDGSTRRCVAARVVSRLPWPAKRFSVARPRATRESGHICREPSTRGPPSRLRGGPMVEEAPSEAHVPAQQSPPRQEARIPPSHGHSSRSQRPSFASSQGPRSPVGLIWRIRDRRSFIELRRHGRRARHGCVAMTFLPAPPGAPVEPPRGGFALPRKVGTAVVRNRLRRQVQAHLRSVAPTMAAGTYLISLQPGAADAERATLLDDVDHCLRRFLPRAS